MKNFGKNLWLFLLLAASVMLAGCPNRGAAGDNPNAGNQTASKPSEGGSGQTTPAKVQSNILFILDSSGSMKERVGDKTKMDAAKEVLNELIGTLSPETNAGLLAYGHRAKDDCKDTELLVPVAPIESDLFRQKVQSLQPLGQTPISYSLTQAAEFLKSNPGKKSIILISDGEETCKEDPCKAAAELKKADIDLKVHVVGFGIEKESAKKQLHCIAEATGGTYKDAGNAGELKETLEGLARDSASTAQPNGGSGRFITVSRNSWGDTIDWKVQIYPAGDEKNRIGGNYYATRGGELPAGVYDFYYWETGFPSRTRKSVVIKAGEETRIVFEDYGRLRVVQKDESGKAINSFPEVYQNGARYLSFSSEKTQELEPGIYDVQGGAMGFAGFQRKGVEIKPGQETLVEAILRP